MLRSLLQYFLIGGLLFGAKSFYDRRHTRGPEITVSVSEAAGDAEVDTAIAEAILLHEARRYGWDREDPVVFTHLVRNMRFIEPESEESDLTLYQRAIAMNMHKHDPVVRARLLYRAREALGFVPASRMPGRRELEAHLTAHPERFEREGRVRFQQVFLSRSKRRASLASDASAMRTRLGSLGDAAPHGLGDPLPGLRSEQVTTASRVSEQYGETLARTLEEGVLGEWRGPVETIYGLHFVKVISKEPASVPDLDVIVAEVRGDLLRELREDLRDERMDALREAYSVHVERLR